MRLLLRFALIILCAGILLGNTQCHQNGSSAGVANVGAPGANCGTSPAAVNGNAPNFDTCLSVEDANGNPTNQFAAGQQIQFAISVHNYNSVPLIVLVYSCVPPVLLVVENASTSQVVFQASYSQPICQWVSSQGVPDTVAAPGATASFDITWYQLQANGELAIPPGTYDAMAFFVCPYPPPADGPNGSYDTADCASANIIPPLSEFTPTPFRSAVVQFTVQ